MYCKLKRAYLTVCRATGRCIRIFVRIWQGFMSVLRTIRNTMDMIGNAILWLIETAILSLKYSLGFISAVSFLGGLIAMLLGFGEISVYLAMLSAFSFLMFYLIFVGGRLGRVRIYYDD